MLNHSGYEVVEDRSPSQDNMIFVCTRTNSPKAIFERPQNAFDRALDKMMKGLGVGNGDHETTIREWLVPGAGYDDMSVKKVSAVGWHVNKVTRYVRSRIGRHTSRHTMLTTSLKKKYTDAAIELQWEKEIRLLFK